MIYGYIRVSTDRQDTENQKIGVISKAHDLGLEIDTYITDDGVSGAKEPEDRLLGKLLKKIKPGDVIIASELSRLGRKLFMIMRILEHCMKVGAKVYTVKDGYELGDNIQSKVLAFAFGLAAEIERNMISQRTTEALKKKKADGMILGRPVGRKNTNENAKLVKNRQKIVAMWSQGVAISAIARIIKVHRLTLSKYMEREGIYTPSKNVRESVFQPFKAEILAMIESGKHYDQILKTLKNKHKMNYSQSGLRAFIGRDEELYELFTERQTEKRITANGGLRINKRNYL